MLGWKTGQRYRRTFAGAPTRPAVKRAVRHAQFVGIKKVAIQCGRDFCAFADSGLPNPWCFWAPVAIVPRPQREGVANQKRRAAFWMAVCSASNFLLVLGVRDTIGVSVPPAVKLELPVGFFTSVRMVYASVRWWDWWLIHESISARIQRDDLPTLIGLGNSPAAISW